MPTNSFRKAIHDRITGGAIGVRVQTAGAIVLERIAMGGGATRWYSCPDRNHLAGLEAQLSPGSQVSFFFDRRIHVAPASPGIAGPMKRIVAETGDVVAGVLARDELHIVMQVISGPTEVDEFVAVVGGSAHIFYGPFPSPDDDGVNAITIVLPDVDGFVRPHPY